VRLIDARVGYRVEYTSNYKRNRSGIITDLLQRSNGKYYIRTDTGDEVLLYRAIVGAYVGNKPLSEVTYIRRGVIYRHVNPCAKPPILYAPRAGYVEAFLAKGLSEALHRRFSKPPYDPVEAVEAVCKAYVFHEL